MTNDELMQLGGAIVANALTIRWVVGSVINYTHLQRDVRELQANKMAQDDKNDKVQNDLKGLSIKIDNVKNLKDRG